MGQRALPVPEITASPHHPPSFPAHLTWRVLWLWLRRTLGIHLFCVGPLPHLRAGLALLPLNFAGGLFFPPLWALPCTVYFPHIRRTFAEGKSSLSATEFIIGLVLTLLKARWVLRWPSPAPQPSRPVSSSSLSFVQPHTRARWPRCGFCTCACFCPHRCTHSARGFSCQPFGLHGPLPASLSETLTFCFR